MTSEIEIERRESGNFVFFALVGDVNETLMPEHLARSIEGRNVVIDLAGVKRVTSFGVRQWIRSLSQLEAQARHVILRNCSYAMVTQFDMIAETTGNAATVASVHAPLICSSCQRESHTICDLRRSVIEQLATKCDGCGGETELEEELSTYFLFNEGVTLSPEGLQLLGELDRLSVEEGPRPSAPQPPLPDPPQPAATYAPPSQARSPTVGEGDAIWPTSAVAEIARQNSEMTVAAVREVARELRHASQASRRFEITVATLVAFAAGLALGLVVALSR